VIDLINQYRWRGEGLRSAIIDGAQLRLRPIIMTACATIFALIPMALGLTGGGVFLSWPLAIVVIGGLVSFDRAPPASGASALLACRAAQRTSPAGQCAGIDWRRGNSVIKLREWCRAHTFTATAVA